MDPGRGAWNLFYKLTIFNFVDLGWFTSRTKTSVKQGQCLVFAGRAGGTKKRAERTGGFVTSVGGVIYRVGDLELNKGYIHGHIQGQIQ